MVVSCQVDHFKVQGKNGTFVSFGRWMNPSISSPGGAYPTCPSFPPTLFLSLLCRSSNRETQNDPVSYISRYGDKQGTYCDPLFRRSASLPSLGVRFSSAPRLNSVRKGQGSFEMTLQQIISTSSTIIQTFSKSHPSTLL